MKLFKKIGNWFKWAYTSLNTIARKNVPIAVRFVEGVKKVMDGPVDDIILTLITTAIPGEADDLLLKKVHGLIETILPKVLLELKMINVTINLATPESQLVALLDQLRFKSTSDKGAFLQEIAAQSVVYLSDGKLTLEEAKKLAQAYYDYYKL